MKKFISILVLTVLALSISVTAFAAEGQATPDSSDADYQIKVDANQFFSDGEEAVEDFIITHYGALSDGRLVLNVDNYHWGWPDVIREYDLGDYYYSYDMAERAYIYADHTFEALEDAYNSGKLSENDLAELAACSEAYMQNPQIEKYFTLIKTGGFEEPTEPAVVTEPAPTEEVTVTEGSNPEEPTTENKSASTGDTPESPSGNAVQTGQGTYAVILIIALFALAGFTAFKFRLNK